ncbi:MAG: hypothetical protein Q9Q40_06285 [Acidobacteriota bacterium]|nr:hypothetical protein [Acidobacteriota bacterium]MDQ7086806.1 hypothetical protein [Acidobacteriota bacterium]
MPLPRQAPRSRRPRPGLTLGLAGLLIVAYGLLVVVSHRVDEQARRRWVAAGGSLEELVRRYPSRETNALAGQVEAVAAGMGLRLRPNWEQGGVVPAAPAAAGWASVRELLGDALAATLQRDHPRIDPLPREVAAYLDRQAGALARLRALLAGPVAPLWRRELERGPRARLPNLPGQIGLQQVLTLDALEAIRRGDRARAEADLEASWWLGTSLREDPVLIEQWGSMVVLHFQAGVLRRLAPAPDRWRRRLASVGGRRLFLDALRHEVAALSKIDPTRLTGDLSLPERLFGALAAPYLRISHADALGRWQQALDGLEARDSLCPPVGRDTLDWRVAAPPWWNRLEDSLQAGFSASRRLLHVQLDLELTRQWLALDELRREAGSGPLRLPPAGDSEACPGERWIPTVLPDGGVALRLSRALPPPPGGWAPPLRYRTGP